MAETVTFGPWLKQRRRLLGLTQEDLARRALCSLSTLRKIETGDLIPSKELAQLIAVAIAVPPAEQASLIAFARGVTVSPPLLAPTALPSVPPVASAHLPLPPLHSAPLIAPARPLPTHNYQLPAQITALVGREWEILLGKQLISRADVRLLTLSGPPGAGKSRLSLAIAKAAQAFFADGVCFVPLTPISDPTLLPDALAQALGLSLEQEQSILVVLQAFLQTKELLLVLDNFEQILAGAETLVTLLEAAPAVKLMVTSRIVLRVYGEHEFPVPPLALPPMPSLPPPSELLHYSAVNLFVQRAQAVRPTFALTSENAETVVQICQAVDGLPLALEMAAAQVKWQPLPHLLSQLQHQRLLLSATARNLPPHQQTLRATLDWSYQRLTPQEQHLLNHLAVFVGGCTVAAVMAVVGADAAVESLLQALVDHSLLRYEMIATGHQRYTLLETIREYGREKLQASACQHQAHQAHAAYFLRLAEEFQSQLTPSNRRAWLDQLDLEHANLRAALAWYAEQDSMAGLRLTLALNWFWHLQGYIHERHHWIHLFLRLTAQQPHDALRAQALQIGAASAMRLGESEEAMQFCQASLVLYQQLADQPGIAKVLMHLGSLAFYRNVYGEAESYYQQALALYRTLGDQHSEASLYGRLGTVAKDQGDFAKARDYYRTGLARQEVLQEPLGIAQALNDLSDLAYWQADFPEAARLAQASLALQRQHENKVGIAYALAALGSAHLQQGAYGRALPLFEESLALFRTVEDRAGLVIGLENWGRLAAAEGRRVEAQRSFQAGITLAWQIREKQRLVFCLEGYAATCDDLIRAVQLYGVAATLRTAIGTPLPLFDRAALEEQLARLRQRLGESVFVQAWRIGQALAVAEAVQLALETV